MTMPQATPKTARKPSMPRRSARPGFKRGRPPNIYWMAKQVVPDPMGFPDPCIALPPDADAATIDRLCQEHTAALDRWLEDLAKPQEEQSEDAAIAAALARLPIYDGRVSTACKIYEAHPYSDFRTVSEKTRGGYLDSLKVIRGSIGQRRIGKATIIDAKRWYKQWRAPKWKNGPERLRRAHGAMAMLRTVLYFLAALGHRDCERLAARLANVKFERPGARVEEMTREQTGLFVRAALDLGERGVMPKDRALAMAIGVAAQFELGVRETDVIGQWRDATAPRRPHEPAPLVCGEEQWFGFFSWENVPGWRWHTRLSKSKYRAPMDFDLRNYPLLFSLLEHVPHTERAGAIVKGEHGLPVRESSYGKWYRQIRLAAGIPAAVQKRDARAGAATEGYEAGATIDDLQGALGHSRPTTTARYIRRNEKRIATVAKARQAIKPAEG